MVKRTLAFDLSYFATNGYLPG